MVHQESVIDYYTGERPELIEFLRQHGRYDTALDIGCAAGILGKNLLEAGVVTACDGIEPHADAANLAQAQLRRVWHGTIDSVEDRIPWNSYKLVVLADVLEHLVDPWKALEKIHVLTTRDCRLLLSVPNVRHYKVSLPLLLKGKFRYADHGIMDRTHLHFFTRSSLIEALDDSGWIPEKLGSHMRSRYRRWYMPTRLLEPFVAVQYLVIARKK